MKLTVYWATNKVDFIRKIRERFGIPQHMSVNRETECDIREEDMPMLRECEKRGFLQIRKKH